MIAFENDMSIPVYNFLNQKFNYVSNNYKFKITNNSSFNFSIVKHKEFPVYDFFKNLNKSDPSNIIKFNVGNEFAVNLFKNNTGLLIRFDDIAPNMNWQLMNKCEELFNKHNIKPLLGVIPNNEDEEILKYEKKENFWEQVRVWQNKGWEISMHGYNHVYDTETNKKDFFGAFQIFLAYRIIDKIFL